MGRIFRRRRARGHLRQLLGWQREVYSAVYRGLEAGIAEMRPGRTNKDAADALIRTADKYGLGGRFLSLFIGHGVGIGANEPPYIGESSPGARHL